MYQEAYVALEAIRQGEAGRLIGKDHWVKAFKACSWAVETAGGLALTAQGLEACEDLAKTYRRARAA
jgi:hypothetical protein